MGSFIINFIMIGKIDFNDNQLYFIRNLLELRHIA